MKTPKVLGILLLALATASCAAPSKPQAQAQQASITGQNDALRAQLPSQMPTVTLIGPVQNSQVPWVEGMTLAQAIATARYVGDNEPQQIIITRQGESATLAAKALLNGADIPVESGDVIELR